MWRCVGVLLLLPTITYADGYSPTGRVSWPGGQIAGTNSTSDDALAAVRWGALDGWVVEEPARLQRFLRALAEFDGHPPQAGISRARRLAQRAVFLRVLGRFDEARAALQRAAEEEPSVLSDPDVALTRAYLLARAERWHEAVTIARAAFPRLNGSRDQRVDAVLEVARWSLQRGNEGIPEALALLQETAQVDRILPTARALLAATLFRAGQREEAREIARGGAVPPSYALVAGTRTGGSLTVLEMRVAISVTLTLAGRGEQAVAELEALRQRSNPVQRTLLETVLPEARRAPPVPVAPLSPSGGRSPAVLRALDY